MLFTAANFITLGVVLVVLVIYRQLDRDNRSLERVKKYADKLKDDISAYVDKRSDDLQRYAIELDVQQKAAQQVLKRIQGVEEGLSARAEAIGAIEKRLGEYDGVLGKLMQMTAAVDENLARLHEESEFTETVSRRLDAAQKAVLALEKDIPGIRADFEHQNATALGEFREDVLATINHRLTETTDVLDKAGSEAKALVLRASDARRDTEKEFEKAFHKARTEAEKLEDLAFEKLKESSDAKVARLKETVEEKFREIGQAAKDKAAETQGLVKALKGEWKAEAEGLLEATKAEVGATAEDLGKRLDAALEKTAKVEHRAEEIAAALQEKAKAALAAHKEEIERQLAQSKATAEAAAATMAGLENKVAADFERRLGEYSSEVEAKFLRLESVNVDIGVMETGLRDAMAVAQSRVEGDFATFQAAFKTRSARFEESFAAEAAALRESMKSLETELDTLKSRAYDNVSEKLKVFEDEFFTDLKARSEGIDARLEAWRQDLERKLGELSSAEAAERVQAERLAMDELRAHLADSQAKAQEQLEKLRDRVQGIADGISAQGGMAKDSLEALKTAVLEDAADARKTAQAYVEAELARLNLESGTRIKEAEKALEAELARLGSGIASETEGLRALREAATGAATAFSQDFKVSLGETKARLEAELGAFKTATIGLTASLRTDYEAQRDGFTKQSQAERERLGKELASLADRSAELRQDLSSRINQALEGFTRGYEGFIADLGRRQKEAEAEAETRLRAFRDAAGDISLKVEAARAQAFGKVETEGSRLSQVLAEIDREQKAYIAQSKVFEKTEALKEDLEKSIETMKQDLGRLDARRAEIAEIENQLGRIRRLEDEMGQKLARFLAEKKRIDALEADFSRLSEVSLGVDRKLEEVTGQSDALTETQTRIRKLLELSGEAEAKLERLEKKAAVLDATAEAVDKNFQQTQGVEKLLAGFGAELKRLPERIQEIKRSVDELASGKDRADEAVRKLGELDSILKDAEKRIADAQKAREWLARAETRLEEVNRQASEQLKLLSTLLKEEGSASKAGASRGAPPSTVQDTVRKLARQGWAPEEIARAVKVSRGEVELILELGGKD